MAQHFLLTALFLVTATDIVLSSLPKSLLSPTRALYVMLHQYFVVFFHSSQSHSVPNIGITKTIATEHNLRNSELLKYNSNAAQMQLMQHVEADPRPQTSFLASKCFPETKTQACNQETNKVHFFFQCNGSRRSGRNQSFDRPFECFIDW